MFARSVVGLRWRLWTDKKVRILHAHTAAGTDFKRTAVMVNMAKRCGLKVILHSHASSFKDFYRDVDEKKKNMDKRSAGESGRTDRSLGVLEDIFHGDWRSGREDCDFA